MSIRDIMTAEPVTATPTMPLRQVVSLLIANQISGLPVVEEDGTIAGVITEMDLIRTYAEPHREFRCAGDLMTRDPFTISVNAPVVDVYDCLMTHNFRRVLIHDDGVLVGLVTRADIMPGILEDLA